MNVARTVTLGNTGSSNTGNLNQGDLNTGDYNSGMGNAGNKNEGSFNTGDGNLGYYNTGDFNITNNSTGAFCTEEQEILIFDKPSGLTLRQWHDSAPYQILNRIQTAVWIPQRNTTNGYLQTYTLKESFTQLWQQLTADEKNIVMQIPNFDRRKFYQITGIHCD